MIPIFGSNNNQEKTKLIIEAAQKRFVVWVNEDNYALGCYGLNMSKELLYYYFPDKEHLYKAVVEKEQNEFLKILKEDIDRNPDPEQNMRKYVNLRISYFKSLFNLNRLIFDFSKKINYFTAALTKYYLKIFFLSKQNFEELT
ncbi:MAG: hypothetical protein HOO91_10245 [Bacteroidales bacterium]|nr:hypothetical protein [Bacteroidales bacterium]